MHAKNCFRKASGLEKRKAQQHRVAHACPDCFADIRIHSDSPYQNGVNRHADDDEKALKSQREQGAQIILPHAARFPVQHRRHRDRRDGSGQIDLNHPSVHDDENADCERPHGKAHENALEPQPEQGAKVHCHEPCLKVCRNGADVDGRIGNDDSRRAVDYTLRHVEYAHDDVPCVGHDEDGTGRFENPTEENGCFDVVKIIFVGDDLNQLQRHDEREDQARDGHHDVFGQGPDHVVNAGVPRLRRRSHLRGNLPDLTVHVVEHARQVVHDAADEYFFQPFGNLLLDEIQTASPPFPRPVNGGVECFCIGISRTGWKAAEPA